MHVSDMATSCLTSFPQKWVLSRVIHALPFSFLLFLNDVVDSVEPDERETFKLNEFNLHILLYADDAVLFSNSKHSLQQMLNKLKVYSDAWQLSVNVNKTKIMIFERGRQSTGTWMYDDTELEVVEHFKYLGIMFYKNGSWYRTQKMFE